MQIQDAETVKLLERVCATTIANQAILKCAFAKHPLTIDHILRHVEDFFDPANDLFAGITSQIEEAIATVVSASRQGSPTSANEN